jgi:hypothetical protein
VPVAFFSISTLSCTAPFRHSTSYLPLSFRVATAGSLYLPASPLTSPQQHSAFFSHLYQVGIRDRLAGGGGRGMGERSGTVDVGRLRRYSMLALALAYAHALSRQVLKSFCLASLT